MRLKCIDSGPFYVDTSGITPNKFYEVVDKDNIGYLIIDDWGRKFWYSDWYFEPIEETRDKIINELLNDI